MTNLTTSTGMKKHLGRPQASRHSHATLLLLLLLVNLPSLRAFVPLQSSVSASLSASSSSLRLPQAASDHGAEGTVASTSRPSTSLPKRKKQKKRKGKKHAASSVTGKVLSEPELSNHIHDVYTHGPGGLYRDVEKSRQRFEDSFCTADTDHTAYLKKLDHHTALVLNADYSPMSYLPLSMWHWQDAIKAVFSGKCQVVDVYPDVTIRAANLEIPLPAVIALTEYVPLNQQRPAFTKRNVFLRDEYRCQYCLEHFHTRDLSLDHVVPRCMGGRLEWENAVTSCRKCNGRKGHLLTSELKQVNMKLAREPIAPTQFQLAASAGRMIPAKVHHSWEPYLGLVRG